jgi:hypothetical protein
MLMENFGCPRQRASRLDNVKRQGYTESELPWYQCSGSPRKLESLNKSPNFEDRIVPYARQLEFPELVR